MLASVATEKLRYTMLEWHRARVFLSLTDGIYEFWIAWRYGGSRRAISSSGLNYEFRRKKDERISLRSRRVRQTLSTVDGWVAEHGRSGS